MGQVNVSIADEELYTAAQSEAQKQGRNLLLGIWLEAVEDAADSADSKAALVEEGENIPWEKVK